MILPSAPLYGYTMTPGTECEPLSRNLFGLVVASYWLPTVLFLTPVFLAYLIYKNLFSFRSFLAAVIGFATVAVWAAVFIVMGWIANPWADFFAKENAWGWIPTGAILLAWLASTIARQILRVR